jgi:hypothetical protein
MAIADGSTAHKSFSLAFSFLLNVYSVDILRRHINNKVYIVKMCGTVLLFMPAALTHPTAPCLVSTSLSCATCVVRDFYGHELPSPSPS